MPKHTTGNAKWNDIKLLPSGLNGSSENWGSPYRKIFSFHRRCWIREWSSLQVLCAAAKEAEPSGAPRRCQEQGEHLEEPVRFATARLLSKPGVRLRLRKHPGAYRWPDYDRQVRLKRGIVRDHVSVGFDRYVLEAGVEE